MAQGDLPGMRAAASRAVELNPWTGSAQYWLGRYLLEVKDFKGAKEALWIAASLLETEPAVHRYLGEAFEGLQNYQQAAVEYRKSLALDPKQPEVQKALARIP
jgi:tetratricopeptide (TPR) repeat protein